MVFKENIIQQYRLKKQIIFEDYSKCITIPGEYTNSVLTNYSSHVMLMSSYNMQIPTSIKAVQCP